MLEIQNVYEEHFTIEEVKKTLEDCSQVNWFAFILHNQDKRLNEQGEETNEVKKAHYHIIIDFTANTHKTIASEALKVLKPLFKDQEIRVKKVLNKVSFTRYLTHKDNPLKFQYSDNEVITSDKEVYNQLIEKQEDKAMEVETMLEKLVYWCLNDKFGFVTERDLATYCMNNHCLKWYVQNIGRVSKMLGQMGVLVTGSTTYEIDN